MSKSGKAKQTRTESDSMGAMSVPSSAYYGASTERARLNFPISSMRLQPSFIRALALIKHSAAEVNSKNGLLAKDKSTAIKRAAREVARGKLAKHFVVDVFQTGSGTSTNMNANEVIAARAREFRGKLRDDRHDVHPNDDVNMGQSSNDVIPTAMHIAALSELESKLQPALSRLQETLSAKSREFTNVIKTGRTHLQDATPITLGQEFQGYAGQIERALDGIVQARSRLSEVALGGTAVGTGINTRADFAQQVCLLLSKELGFEIKETSNHFQAQSTIDGAVHMSGALKVLAVTLMK